MPILNRKSEYSTWRNARRRCEDAGDVAYRNYGGRGITMCAEWRASFEEFYRDMGPRPPGLTLDRIDNDGPYCKANCRWATWSQQMANRRLRTHCKRGHPLAEPNLHHRPNGDRTCRACNLVHITANNRRLSARKRCVYFWLTDALTGWPAQP